MILENRSLCEKFSQLKKAIEIVGGKEYLSGSNQDENEINDSKFIELILQKVLEGNKVEFDIQGKSFTIDELLKLKLEYEKFFLKNKGKAIDGIVYKIKKYDTSLDSEIRKYKKINSIEMFNDIYDTIEKRYRRDINLVVLRELGIEKVECLLLEEENKFYGEYLSQKKKQIIHGIISKMGIN